MVYFDDVADQFLVLPRFTPLEVGLRADIEVARRRAGQGFDGPGRREP